MLERFLCIRPNEKRSIFFFSLLAFAWSISVSFGVAFSDCLLIQRVGTESLPQAFTFTALGLLGSSLIFIYLFNRKPIHQIYYIWTAGSICYFTLVVLGFSMQIHSPHFYILNKALSYICQLGFYSCFWTFIDQYFELQNAKRLFGIFYSAIFLGTTVSGMLMTFAGQISIDPKFILLITSFPLLSSALLVRYIHYSFEKLPDDFEQFVVIRSSAKELVRSIISSPFTILLLLFCITMQVLMVITEYEYMFGLQQYFMPTQGEGLTQMLGKLYFFGGLFNIFFGILLYGRLIKKAGLNNVLLIVPAFFCSLFFGWSFSSHLTLTIMGFFAVEGVMTLVEDNNFNLLLNAVPIKLKSKIRIICESFVEPLGILLSSALIWIFNSHSRVMGLFLSFAMMGIGLLMRAYYTKGIFYNLITHVLPYKEQSHQWENTISRKDYQKSKQKYIHEFSSLKEKEQLFILESGLRFNDLKLLHALMAQISSLSSQLKLKFIELLCAYSKDLSIELQSYLQFWVQQEPSLYKHFIFHLAKMNLIKPNQLKITPCPYNQASHALLHDQDNEIEKAESIISKLLLSEDFLDNRIAIEAIGFLSSCSFNFVLVELLKNKPQHREAILSALSKTIDRESRHWLSTLLEEHRSEKEVSLRYLLVDCIEKVMTAKDIKEVLLNTQKWHEPEKQDIAHAISQLEGDVISPLIEILEDESQEEAVRLFAAKILSKINKKSLKTSFQKIIEREVHKVHLFYYHLITIQKSYPYSNLTVLRQALRDSCNTTIDFIIQVLAQMKNFSEAGILIQCLHSKNPKTASHAQETLQKLCSYKLYKKIKPVVETGHEKEFFKYYHENKFPIYSLDQILDYLACSASNVNQKIIKSLKNRLNMNSLDQEKHKPVESTY